MKSFTNLNILVIFLALQAISCQNAEGFLSELVSSEKKYYEMALRNPVSEEQSKVSLNPANMNSLSNFEEGRFIMRLHRDFLKKGFTRK